MSPTDRPLTALHITEEAIFILGDMGATHPAHGWPPPTRRRRTITTLTRRHVIPMSTTKNTSPYAVTSTEHPLTPGCVTLYAARVHRSFAHTTLTAHGPTIR